MISIHSNLLSTVEKRRLTSRYRDCHRLLLFGLAPPTAHLARVADDRSFAAALTASGAHHERARVHGLLRRRQHAGSEMQRCDALKDVGGGVGLGGAGGLTMPEPLQAGQRCTLLPGSWPLPSQRWQAASMLREISLLTPFAACVNVRSITYWVQRESGCQVFEGSTKGEGRDPLQSLFRVEPPGADQIWC